jgi:GT2 family glycosyltransferase/glycosyltransferase involved in cell wall biosynthesis
LLTLAVTYAELLGGAERTLVDFARGLPGGVVVGCPEGPVAERARAAGLTVIALPARPLELRSGRLAAARELAGHARDVRRLVRSLRPDLLLTWGMRSTIVAPAALAGLSPRPAHLVRHLDLLPGPLIARLVRRAAGRADRVSVNSAAVARDLDPAGRLGERLVITPPGVDLSAYPAAEWSAAARPEVLVLGAIVAVKRLDLALEAVALAARALPDLRLVVAGAPMGAGGERLLADLRRRAGRPDLDGRVRFAGELPDPRDALRSAWCLLHCADREAFGAVLVQALASGRPAVAPAGGGPLEVIDESCGRLYRPGDAVDAARALVEVLGDSQRTRELGAAARARAERFDAGPARRAFAKVAADAVASRAGADRAAVAPGTGMALVTVTHNSREELLALLRSVRRHLPGARVIVVDSGSEDGGPEAARASGLAATVVELGENVGFGRASNAGVRVAEEPVCVLVNPDVELVDDSLARLAAALVADPAGEERILAPAVLSVDGSRQDTAQIDPGSPLSLLRALVPPAALPARLRTRVDPWRSDRPRRVGWAVGCCLVARTATLRRLGPFDERIFLFGEDLELGMRAAAAGVATWFCPEARLLHLDAHSTGPAFGGEPHELFARRRRAVIGELRGPAAARRDGLLWMLTFADRIALKTLARRSTARERSQLRAQWRARKAPLSLSS